MDVNLYWQAYKLLPYEKMLARKEVQALLKPKSIIEQKDCLVAKDCASPEKAECTTFFISYEYDGIRKETIQHIREGNERKRQNTRYYVHGIHEYKGKFYCHYKYWSDSVYIGAYDNTDIIEEIIQNYIDNSKLPFEKRNLDTSKIHSIILKHIKNGKVRDSKKEYV